MTKIKDDPAHLKLELPSHKPYVNIGTIGSTEVIIQTNCEGITKVKLEEFKI